MASVWEVLSSVGADPGHMSARQLDQKVNLHAAIDHQGIRHALVALPDAEKGVTDEESRGLRVTTSSLSINNQPDQPYLVLTCTDPANNGLFEVVIQDLLAQMCTEPDAVRSVRRTLDRWRRFWSRPPMAPLRGERLQGLFGELWFLRFWLLRHGTAHVQHWYGPTGSRHDFQWADKAVEVKTTLNTRGHIHVISGLDQLEAPETGDLYLFSLQLRAEPTAGNSVPALVKGLRALLATAPAELTTLEERLFEAGYSPAHDPEYEESRFRILGEQLYHVTTGFPRLGPGSFIGGVPSGVEGVTYTINLAACPGLCVGQAPENPGVTFGTGE